MKPLTRIIQILAVEPFSITCQFNDGSVKTVDLSTIVERLDHDKLGRPLSNPVYFMQVTIDQMGGLRWPNGFDYSPLSAYQGGRVVEPVASL